MPATMEAPETMRARKAVMWTREDCQKLQGMGILPDRWELVQGELISKTGTNLPHGRIALRIAKWLLQCVLSDQIVLGCSIDVAPEDNPTSEPEPDIFVLNRPSDELDRNPIPSDIELLIEVSDTTLADDLGVKAQLYARAGISEYWVIDVKGNRIHQHREPHKSGYASVRIVEAEQPLSPLSRPDALLTPNALFA